jgi:hypothetical protein
MRPTGVTARMVAEDADIRLGHGAGSEIFPSRFNDDALPSDQKLGKNRNQNAFGLNSEIKAEELDSSAFSG